MVNAFTLKEWADSPRTLAESLAWAAVESGADGARDFAWKGATKEPFLTLEAQGAIKRESVTRLTDGNVTIHFWQATDGTRSHLKVKTT